MHSSLGAYTKGLAPHLMVRDLVVLACSFPILLAISTLGLKKQDK
jgi:ribosome-dependent ATPase